MPLDIKTCWHNQSIESVFSKLKASRSGLTHDEATLRQETYGLNQLQTQPGHNAIWRFMLQFHSVLIYVLIVAAIVTIFLNHITDAIVIITVIIVNATIGFMHENKAEKAIAAIRHMLAHKAFVLRSNQCHHIDSKLLVPGDMVILKAGDLIPADLRLTQTNGFQVNEAILTGESMPIAKSTSPVPSESALADRTCLAYSGTMATTGHAKGLVIATGMETEIGRISGMISTVETLTTPLVDKMNIFSRRLTLVTVAVSGLIFGFGYFVQHYDLTELLMITVGFAVAAIPEGLPAVLTITLAIGVQTLARRNTIVRHLPAIETLGAVSVICTDKTGTLTKNEMTVTAVITSQNTYTIEGVGYQPDGAIKLKDDIINIDQNILFPILGRASALCNDSILQPTNGRWGVAGDPMEGALLVLAAKTGLNLHEADDNYQRIDIIPFDSKYYFMATLNQDKTGHKHIYVKGAPEAILSMCEKQMTDCGDIEPININYWEQNLHLMAGQGRRILAVAMRPVRPSHRKLNHEDVNGKLILLAMVAIIDPPREEAIEAIAQCHKAGINVKMITGDHAMTASAIGEQIGLRNSAKVLTGKDLENMDDNTLGSVIACTNIFARTSPEQKLRLVMALQDCGMIVAMTGDGINDAPSLKRADAGIAMGGKGSDAAKEASEFVLVDDNFASIVAAVREGRTVHDNLRKIISWTLPTNAGESLTIVVALLAGMTLPVTPIQILWINLITSITLGVALAFEPTEENTMRRNPRSRYSVLLTPSLIWHIVLVSAIFLTGVFGIFTYAIEKGYPIELSRTIAVNTIVSMEIFHLFFIRNIYGTSLTWGIVRGTNILWLLVSIVIAGQFAITYTPFLQKIFGTQAVPLFDGLLIIAAGVGLFCIVEVEKEVRLCITKWLRDRK